MDRQPSKANEAPYQEKEPKPLDFRASTAEHAQKQVLTLLAYARHHSPYVPLLYFSVTRLFLACIIYALRDPRILKTESLGKKAKNDGMSRDRTGDL